LEQSPPQAAETQVAARTLSTPRPIISNPIQALEQAVGRSPLEAASLLCQPSASSNAYCIYTVREGDTLSEIAETFGLNGGEVPGWELLAASNKPEIVSVDDFILPGQNLRIPRSRGVVHTTILGETVGDLAETFDVTSAAIIQANSLGTGNLIGIGQVLLIPDPKQTSKPAPPEPTPTAAPPEPTPGNPRTDPTAAPRRSSDGFIWPLRTAIKVTNYFGPRHPLGIDMGLAHDPGTSILAVGDGTVAFAGGDRCCSYGLYVIVDHGNGLKTLYAHLSRLDVRQGQTVLQGQALGPAGSTGYSFGVHLHFEVHLNGKRVNPINYQP
jgi:murein DD-endopeptidase MepM/ murein hydrolase activator NlpD